jgi:Ser/Thr protein kinase RdoA (MazF antagonist)
VLVRTHFPVIISTLSPQTLIEEILPGYGIGGVRECKFYSGGFNHTYRVKMVAGETYYLRAYRPQWRALEDILYELDVLEHLERKGFPAARPVLYKDNRSYCAVEAPEGRRYLALFTEAPGVEVSYAQEPSIFARHYGQAVALMHNSLDDFSSPHHRFQLDLDYFTLQPLRTIQPFLSHHPKDWEYVQHFAATLRKRILELPEEALEKGFCHGDLQGYHANLASDGTLTFFDFDCSGYGYRAYDLAVFLWCCRLQDAVQTRWEAFLSGYQEKRTLQELDVSAAPLFACARYLWHMGVHTQNSPDWGIDFLNDEYFGSHLTRLRAAEEDYLVGGNHQNKDC